MTPSEFIETDWNQIIGIVLKNCSPNSHVAILARSYGIPMLTDFKISLNRMKNVKNAILDGKKGCLIIEPSPKLLKEYQKNVQNNFEEIQLNLSKLAKPSFNSKGDRILVKINADSMDLLTKIDPEHCDGIGLTRTEFLIKDGHIPSEEEQFQVYSNLVKWSCGKPITIRTFDVGGDKPVEGITNNEENSFLGFRGIRVSLKFKDLFRSQIRALLRATALGPIQVMLPMVTIPEEVEETREIITEEYLNLCEKGIKLVYPN